MCVCVRRLPYVLLSLLSLAWVGAQAETRVVDDLGRELSLQQPAQRVVSLAPHLTELVFAIGAGERLVGADMRSDYPPAALALPRIGRAGRIDMERLLALQPDLVLAWQSGNPAAQLDALRGLGLRVFHSEPRRPQAIIDNIRQLGRLLGAEVGAESLAGRLQARLDRLSAQHQGSTPVRVFYQVWNEPLITFNGEHLVSQGLALCGGVNVFADLVGLAPRISVESVLAAKPELIVASGIADERPPWLDEWRRWPDLPAVRDDRLHVLHPDLAFRHTPRFFDGLERLCEWLDQARRQSQSGAK